MSPIRRPAARRVAPVAAVALTAVMAGSVMTAAAVEAAGQVSGAESAATSKAALDFVVPVKTQSVQRFKGEPIALYGLGFYAVAPKTLEIRTDRGKSYKNPITTKLIVGEGDSKVTKTLPANITASPSTLTKFFDLKVTRPARRCTRASSTSA